MERTSSLTRGNMIKGCPYMMALASKMTLALSLPVTLAALSFLAAAAADDRESMWWLRMAVTFVVAGVLVGRTTWLGDQHHQLVDRNLVLEERDISLSRRLRALEKNHAELHHTVEARLAIREWSNAYSGRPIRLVVPQEV